MKYRAKPVAGIELPNRATPDAPVPCGPRASGAIIGLTWRAGGLRVEPGAQVSPSRSAAPGHQTAGRRQVCRRASPSRSVVPASTGLTARRSDALTVTPLDSGI
jgi:hypothetical protein